jgi:hypothetical protein
LPKCLVGRNSKVSNAGRCHRLDKAGLRNAAETLRGEIRQRLIASGKTRKEAGAAADDEMWGTFRPLVEQFEAGGKPEAAETAPQLPGIPSDINSILDPHYSEADPGRQLRDGLLWAALQFERIVEDTEDGPIAHLDAGPPPPNGFGILILRLYALSGIDKRRELVGRALQFATKSHDTDSSDQPQGDEEKGGFLEEIS